MPKGYRRDYIPGWNKECQELYEKFLNADDQEERNLVETAFIDHLNNGARRQRWMEMVTHSSTKA